MCTDMACRLAVPQLQQQHFDATKYAQALRAIRALKQQLPKEVYVSHGPEDMGIALVLKISTRAEWTLMLPLDPMKDEMEVGFTYGIVSRGATWSYIKAVLCILCKTVPGAFHFAYQDDDVEEHGRWDATLGEFVVTHGNLAAPMMAAGQQRQGNAHGGRH